MAETDDKSLEQLYTLEVAAELIPFPSYAALVLWLGRHKSEFPGRYRFTHKPGQRLGSVPQRMLTHSECVRIRKMTVVELDLSYRGPRPGVQRTGNRYEFHRESSPYRDRQKT